MKKATTAFIHAGVLGIVFAITAITALAQSPATMTFTYGVGPNSKLNTTFEACSPILTIAGSSISGYLFCPNQATDSNTVNASNVGSLYIEPFNGSDGIYEDMLITYGPRANQTYNSNGSINTFDQTGTFSGMQMTGTITSHLQAVYTYNRRSILVLAGFRVLSGSGTITAAD
jgi:hypothetical protein